MSSIREYTYHVHRSMIRRDLVFGVPRIALFIVIIVSLFFVLQFSMYWFLVITVAVLVLMRALTARDEYLLNFVLNSMLQPDDLYP